MDAATDKEVWSNRSYGGFDPFGAKPAADDVTKGLLGAKRGLT
jgi:hypothetical protein